MAPCLVQKLELLHRLFGDAALRDGLAAERERELREGKRARAMAELRADSARDTLDLRKAPIGSLIEIGLFWQKDFQDYETTSEFVDGLDPDLTVKGIRNEGGLKIVLQDLHEVRSDFLPELPVHEIIPIGSRSGESGNRTIDPVLYWESPVFALVNDSVLKLRVRDASKEKVPLFLGYAMVDNEVILPHGYAENDVE